MKINFINPGLPEIKQIYYLTFVINLNNKVSKIYYIVKVVQTGIEIKLFIVLLY